MDEGNSDKGNGYTPEAYIISSSATGGSYRIDFLPVGDSDEDAPNKDFLRDLYCEGAKISSNGDASVPKVLRNGVVNTFDEKKKVLEDFDELRRQERSRRFALE